MRSLLITRNASTKLTIYYCGKKLISENVGSKMANAIQMYSVVRSVVKYKQETSDIIDIQ